MSGIANPSSVMDTSPPGTPPQAPVQAPAEVPAQAPTEVPTQEQADTQGMELDSISEVKVYKVGKTLPREVHQEIFKQDVQHYTDKLFVGNEGDDPTHTVSTADIFSLRGADVNKSRLPQGIDGGQKLRTMIWDSGSSSNDVLIGAHLQLSIDDAQAIEDDKKPSNIEPPRDECVKVKFHLDTQCPYIELSTFDPSTNTVIATRIFAHEIRRNFDDWTAETPMEFRVMGEFDSTVVDLESGELDASWEPLRKMQKMTKHCLLFIGVKLDAAAGERHWDGIARQHLASIRTNPSNSVRDRLVTCLDQTKDFGLYLSVKRTKGLVTAWSEKFASYFSRLCAITKHYGTFWFYRRQVELALGNPDAMIDEGEDENLEKAIEKPELPKIDWIVPRFLVKEWSVTETTNSEGEISYSDIKPYSWAPLEFPSQFPDSNVAAFLLKLAIEEERTYQIRSIKALAHSSGGKFFRGSYKHMVGTTYLVTIYLGREATGNTDVKLPGPGVRVQVKVDRGVEDPPQPDTTATLSGMVIDTGDDSEDTFTCVCDLKGPKLAGADGRGDYATIIEYIIDDVPYQRQMKSIAVLQRVSSDGEGPDVKSLIFNHQVPRKADRMTEAPSPADRATFERGLSKGFPFPPDKTQLAPCLDTFDSSSGITVIVGPPGCGKTETDVRIAFGHASLGRRILGMGPTNASVHTLLDKFIEHNSKLGPDDKIADDDWVLFNGTHCRIRNAELLKRRQTKDEAQLASFNNMYVEYLHAAESQRNSPRYEQTMGHKMQLKIRIWASDPSFAKEVIEGGDNLHNLSRKYLDVEEKIFYLEGEFAARARKDQRNREETLAYEFIRRVKFVFCTLSSSAHDMMLESGHWDEVIVDEAARETRAGIAVFLAAFHGRYTHITWSGDHMQGGGVVSGSNANTGYNLLVRNVFEQLVDVLNKNLDDATPTGAFTLETCYRMSGPLIKWSSDTCYGGRVKSHPSTGQWNEPLRNTLAAFWAQRLPDGFRGSYEQICFDATGHEIRSQQEKGSTSRFNVHEADIMAYWMIELLEYKQPSNTADKQYARVRGEDILCASNFIDQVSWIRRRLLAQSVSKSAYIQQEVKNILVMLETIGTIQGKERPIAFYCTVLAVGHTRLGPNEDLPIGFVANVKNFNVAMTRQRVARYNVGAFQLFAQALKDGRKVCHKYGEFFKYVRQMETGGFILSFSQVRELINNGKIGSTALGFSQSLQAQVTYTEEPVPKPTQKNTTGMHSSDSRAKTTAKSQAQQQKAPANVKFAGQRDKNGNLLDQSKVHKKRGKRGGKKFNQDGNGGPSEGDGSAGAAAAAS